MIKVRSCPQSLGTSTQYAEILETKGLCFDQLCLSNTDPLKYVVYLVVLCVVQQVN